MAEGLRKAGHEAIHVGELGMGTATDKEIMNYALTPESGNRFGRY
jgi:predicted nuclease of predicted toxin-antitoxin system